MGFGNFLRGIAAQINPFDNGKTYGSYNPRKRRPEEQPQAPSAPRQQINRPSYQTYFQDNTPKPQQPQNLFADLNKALTPNYSNRVSVSSNPAPEQPQNRQPGLASRVASGIVNPFAKFGNEVLSLGSQAGDLAKIAAANLTNNQVARRNALNADNAARITAPGGGLGHQGGISTVSNPGGATFIGPNAFRNIKSTVGLGAEIGSNVVAPAAGFMARGANIGTRLLRGAGVGGAIGTTGSAGSQLAENGNINARDTAISAASGGALGGLGTVLSSIVRNFINRAPNVRAAPSIATTPSPSNVLLRPADSSSFPINVRNLTEARPIIREFPGDASMATSNQSIAEIVDNIRLKNIKNAFDESKRSSRPDLKMEGVSPRTEVPFSLDQKAVATSRDKLIEEYASLLRSFGEGNGVFINRITNTRQSNNYRPGMGSGRVTKAQWYDEAKKQLESGTAESSIQKAFDEANDPNIQSLLANADQVDTPVGRPISVKSVTGIPVVDSSNMPINLPETPGAVRTMTAKSPSSLKSEAVAKTPIVSLPREIQNILDNPKQFNKRQVAAARNQRKLARQMAKTQEDTAQAISRLETSRATTTTQPEGFAPTGKFARGKKGNVYEKTSSSAESLAGQREMASRSIDDLLAEVGPKKSFDPGDRRRIQAAIENIVKSNPGDTETRLMLKKLQSKSRTELAQGLAMWPRIVRKSATSDTLTNRWENKIAKALDDPSKMSDNDFAEIQRANDSFTLARDRAAQLDEQFKKTGSEADFKAWENAYNAARKADDDAKFTEVSVAKRILSGEKGASANKVLDDLKKESSVNSMDLITSNMLSGTATGFRNTFGTELGGIENRVGANIRAKVTKALFNENVGGFSSEGARLGRKVGLVKLKNDATRRAEIGGKNPLEWAKNWATTINSGGESSLQSQVYSRLGKYYENELKSQGVTGKELDMRMRHAMLTDPQNMSETYLDAAMKSSGLTGLFEKGQTIEKAVTDYVGRQTDSKALQGASKLIMRLAVGFPTATTNFLNQSAKRLTVGLPSYIETGIKLSKGDKFGAAQAFDRAMKESGSGTAILGLGAALGSAGLVSGAYPSDPDERAKWEREGISENSIKIGDSWYPIPQGAGMLGLPLLTGAAVGRDGADGLKEMYSPKNLSKLLPTDQLQGFLNMVSGDGAPQDFKNFVASSVRASTPVGALFNQISRSFDETKNDTTTKDLWSNIIDQVASGIPGVNNAMNIPDKTDKAGNPIANPNPLEIALGATSTSQAAGIEQSKAKQANIDSKLSGIAKYGIFDDPTLESILDEDTKLIYNNAKSGKQIDDSDIKKLQQELVKGVSSEGTDTAYLERGEYDTNLAALQLKRDLMAEDPTVKPSSLKDIDVAIKRGKVYKDYKVPYDLISGYKSTGVVEWRNMGDPESDSYDPKMYKKLWALDEKLTNAGVSYRKGSLNKQKYYAKDKSGGKGRRARSIDTSFGTLKSGEFAPKIKQYETIESKSGNIPIIRTVRPNIVHKIGVTG